MGSFSSKLYLIIVLYIIVCLFSSIFRHFPVAFMLYTCIWCKICRLGTLKPVTRRFTSFLTRHLSELHLLRSVYVRRDYTSVLWRLLHYVNLLQIKAYEKLETVEERMKQARDIYDNFIMKELLAHTHVSIALSLSIGALRKTFHIPGLLHGVSPTCTKTFNEKRCSG